MEKLQFAVNILPYLVPIASAVAALTPTEVDNRAVAWLRRIVDVLALNVGYAKRHEPGRAFIESSSAANEILEPRRRDQPPPGKLGHHQRARTRGGRHRG